jgi:endoglucanase
MFSSSAPTLGPDIMTCVSNAGHIPMVGVNLQGAEWGQSGDAYGTTWIFPNYSEIDYYAAKGMDVIRLPFLWERVQPQQNGPLEATELARIDDFVDYAATKGVKVILDPHNYGYGYNNLIGSAGTPDSSFANFWGQMAAHFSSDTNVIFGLMNEPHDQTAIHWLASANAAIGAIRATGAVQKILVPGSYWTAAGSWVSSDNDTTVGAGVKDPLNNYAFEVHSYFDSDASGTHPEIASPTIGVDRLASITEWAKDTNSTLFLAEFGVNGNDPMALKAMDDMLAFMEQNSDVWQGATYWAGGPWFTDHWMSIEPSTDASGNYIDRPQMDVLEKYAQWDLFP